jgi:phosphoesterase RecJ-like protein
MTVDWAPVVGHLRGADDILFVGHVNPDADALGSALAAAIAVESLGARPRVTFPDDPFEVPDSLRFLPRADLIVDPADVAGAPVVVSMDASSPDRLGRLFAVAHAAQTFIAVDHHASFEPFAHLNVIDPHQPATGMLVLDLIDVLGVELDHDIALCLYAALSSDTGSFRFASTTPGTLRAAARLMDVGIDFAGAAKALFDTRSVDFLALQSRVLADLRIRSAGGVRVAVAHVAREVRAEYGIAFPQVESLIDVVRTVEQVDVAVVLKQDDAGIWRVSSRSHGHVDVGSACTACGGGGHRMAAGFTGTTDAEQTLTMFLYQVARAAG